MHLVHCGISVKNELTLHIILYTTLICVQSVVHRAELESIFICYLVLATCCLLLGCLAIQFNANLLLVPLLLIIVFDMFRFLTCAVSMTVGTRSYFFSHCKIWFLVNHGEPADYTWAATYAIIFLYLYWTVATLNKIIGKVNYHVLQPPGQTAQYPLILPGTPEVSQNEDSPPKYARLMTKLETPPPRYAQLQLV